MNRNWLVSKTNPEFLRYLSKKASVSPVLIQVLVNRGIRDAVSIKNFLNPCISDLHDPFLMPDMEYAVIRLKKAVEKNETVFVHGDYDADGITSTALLVSALRKLGLRVFYHIPNRIIEGYGISITGMQKAKESGADLIVTADCGISSEQEVSRALSMDMDVIITDHHEPPDKLPAATACIDAYREDSVYPFQHLAGVGVTFKLIQALATEFDCLKDSLEKYLDLVTLGTVADSVPLIGENRVFVAHGLKVMNRDHCRTGIKAMKEVANVDGNLRSGLLSYTLIPRINAAGRLDDAKEVVELFLTEEIRKARQIARFLDIQNRKRQTIEGEVFQSALEMINPEDVNNAIILSSRDWHPGVTGIVASRLVEMFYRPVFLFSVSENTAKGSARSIPPFHLHEGISECSDVLIGFGGHRQAAGLKILTENLSAFGERMNFIVKRSLTAEDLIPILEIDATVRFSDISVNLIKELSRLEPFGMSNRAPVFGSKEIRIVDSRIVGNNHLKMQLRQNNISVDTIGFSMGDQMADIKSASAIDIAFMPGINEWNGMKNIQFNLKAVRPSV